MELSEESKYFVHDLNATRPLHSGQLIVGRALFVELKRKIFAQCGRKFGKSWMALYCAFRMAGSIPKLPVFIVLPALKQAKEVYWIQGLAQNFVHQRFIKKIDNQDCRIYLWNGSFIKFDGSDSPELHRGPEVGFLINDEVKDQDPYYWPAMRFNLIKWKAAFVCFGTPPENEVTPKEKMFHTLVNECKNSPDGLWVCLPHTLNPHLPKEELEEIKTNYISTQQEDVYERECLGIYRRGGSKWIFPQFSEEAHIVPEAALTQHLTWKIGLNEFEFHVIADPGTAKIFGMLFIAYHRPTKRLYVLDELYVSDQTKNSVRAMYDSESAIIQSIYPYPDDWKYTYDEAALWFWNERATNAYPRRPWCPTAKAQQKKQFQELKPGTSLLKTLFAYNFITISSKCINLVEEIKSCSINANGDFTSDKNHLLDCLRYFLFRVAYATPALSAPPVEVEKPSAQYKKPPTNLDEGIDFEVLNQYEDEQNSFDEDQWV